MMVSSRFYISASAVLAVLAFPALVPTLAFAQEGGVNGHGFGLTAQDGDIRDPLTVERPGKMTAGDFYASALIEYADGTMDQVIRNPDGSAADRRTYLDNLLGANLTAGASLHKMLRVDLRLPVFFAARGYNANDPAGQPMGGGLGSMRAAVMFAPLTPADGGFGLGIVPWLDLPTATHSKNMGYRGLSGGTKLAATVEAGPLTVGGDVGLAFRPQVEGYENIAGTDQLVAGIGAGFAINDNLGVNLEANFNPSLASKDIRDAIPDGVPGWAESPSEALLSFRGRTGSGAHFLVGGATALSPGVGAARFRIFIGGGFGKISDAGGGRIGDADKDGIADDKDACPADPEVVNDYKDADGCPDKLGSLGIIAKQYYDVVPDVELTITGMGDTRQVKTAKDPVTLDNLMPGAYDVRAMDSKYEGNIQIRIKEGPNKVELEVQPTTPGTLVVSAVDEAGKPVPNALVTVAAPGGGQGKEMKLGAAGDGRMDLAPGYYSVFVQSEGYGIFREDTNIVASDATNVKAVLTKAKTEIKKERIEILEKVFFQQGSAVIQSQSFPLLDEVANVMLRNADIKLIEVAGHTSSEGSLDVNNKLSQDRANAVMNYLIERGVSDNRLQAVGYGPSQPLVPEKTEDDRAKNRRVEFVIKKRVVPTTNR
jgi:outer membrane protein OmpA-like peptidoglycan-associated protein